MFDIKNLSFKDWIIIGLTIFIISLGYKFYTSHLQIKKLSDDIAVLKKKLDTNKLTNVDSVISSSDSESESNNYKTIKTIETFNNNKINKVNKVECNDNTCWLSNKVNLDNQTQNQPQPQPQVQKQIFNQINQTNLVKTKNQTKNQDQDQDQDRVVNQDLNMYVDQTQYTNHHTNQYTNQYTNHHTNHHTNQYTNHHTDQFNQLLPITQENIGEMKDIASFLTMANNMADEVDKIMENDICIPIDFKQIINQIYESTETSSNNNPNFNPVILDNNDIIEVKPDQINSKLELDTVPDFINIPETFDTVVDKLILKQEEQDVQVDEDVEVFSESLKYKTMKINDIKNLAKGLNIKLTEHGRPKNKEQLIGEINKCQSTNSQKNI